MKGFLTFLLLGQLAISANADSISQMKDELRQEKYSRAATTGLSLLRQQPDDIQVLFLTALAFQHNQQPEQAARYYREIIDRQPDLPEPRNNLALIQMQQGNHEQAADLLISSINTHPSYATAWRNLNMLYQGLASNTYNKALSDKRHNGDVLDRVQLVALNNLHSLAGDDQTQTQAQPKVAQQPATVVAAAPVTGITATDETADPKQVTAVKADPEKELIEVVQKWAEAWDGKDFETYISAYTSDFKGRQRTHQAWVRHRRERIVRPGDISVKLSQIQLRSHNNKRAVIDFHQSFRSPTYRDKVAKRIVLISVNNRWLISRESTLAVL